MSISYNHCPLCGKATKDGVFICEQCGFNSLEIDIYGTKDIDQIRAEQKKRNIKVWSKGVSSLLISLLVITVVLSYIIAYSKYGYVFMPFSDPDFLNTFILWFFIIGAVSGIIFNTIYKYKKEMVNGFLKERSSIIAKVKAAKDLEEFEKKQIIKYGEGHINLGYDICINESTNKVFFGDRTYKFGDILGFSVQDNATTIHSASTSTAKTNNKNMLGRAIVGGVLMGNVGAVIGGVTASKKMEQSESQSTVSHDYSVVVTVNNIASPTEIIRLGEDETTLNRIVSTLTVILNRNKD